MTHCLGRRRIDHIVLERGQIAERWRSERSGHVASPHSQLDEQAPQVGPTTGTIPTEPMTAPEFVGYLEAYAAASRAPVQAGAGVISVCPSSHGYRVETSRGVW